MKELQKRFIPVMLTPFQTSGEVDYYGLTALTEFYLESGARGLFANCLSSEMYALTPAERLEVVRHVVDVVPNEIPVVATGVFEGPVEEQADFAKSMYDTGVQTVIITTNMMATADESDAVLADRVHRLLDLTDSIPVGFYECPVPYKRVLSPALLQQFVATGRVKYHKDTCLDINQIRDKLALVNGADFGLYDAYMGHAVESLRAGAAGLSCIQGNYFPELIVWLCDHYATPSLQPKVHQLQHLLIRHMDIMHHDYPVAAKYYLQQQGLPISVTTREGSGKLTSETRQVMDNLCRECVTFREELGIEVVK